MVRARHSIIFNGQRLRVANITYLQRHSTREEMKTSKDIAGAPLTKPGKVEAKVEGKTLPPNLKLTVYHSPTRRTRDTARLARKGFIEVGGKVGRFSPGYNGRPRGILGTDLILKPKQIMEIYKKVKGNDGEIIKLWVDGKLPADAVVPANEIAEKIIRQRFGLTTKALKKGIIGRQLLNVTHDYMLVAVFEALTGRKFFRLFKSSPKPNQRLTTFHTTDGRTILEYNRKRFDVTNKLNSILN